MFKRGCEVEIVTYIDRKWYDYLTFNKPEYTAIKYDATYYFVLKDDIIERICYSEIQNSIKSITRKITNCQSALVAKEWLRNSYENGIKFNSEKAFIKRYLDLALRSNKDGRK
jgi:hypothetical protein